MTTRGQALHNAKGRASSGGKRKKGKVNKKKANGEGEENGMAGASGEAMVVDSNAEILTHKSKEDKERERKEKMLKEMQEQTDAKWTQKKKKRLEKYIEKKLKKEERVQIFEKLAQSQATLSSAMLQSSSMLGSKKVLTHQELLDKQEDKEVRDALEGKTTGKRKRRPQDERYSVHQAGGEDEDEDEDEDDELASRYASRPTTERPIESTPEEPAAPLEPSVTVDLSSAHVKLPEAKPVAVGSALRRNADGTIVQPKIRKRTKQISKKGWGIKEATPEEQDSDTSFDSSDSAYDSASDDEEEENSDGEEANGGEGDSEQGSSEDESDASEDQPPPPKKKSLGFKEWATKQINASKGLSANAGEEQLAPDLMAQPARKRAKLDPSEPQEMRGPLGEELQLPTSAFAQHVLEAEKAVTTAGPSSQPSSTYKRAVQISRPPDVEEARLLLPIVTEEQPIMEAIMLNPVVVICGETGSGKTTQVPQFLYEAGFGTPGSDNPGMIGITQPRRVAAMSMASRVGHELSLTSSKVSYQIRYDATVSPSTSIKFMTDGYSVIIIDEAHERSINTDILIGVLSRVIKLREERWKEKKEGAKPLRLIIIRRTSPDYVKEAIKKTAKIHSRLPPGGILIFLTGQNEITGVCKKLEARFGQKALDAKRQKRVALSARFQMEKENEEEKGSVNPSQVALEVEDIDFGADRGDQDLADDVDNGMVEDDPDALDTDDEDGDDALNESLGLEETDAPMHIVPLYSLLPSDKQMKVFEQPPPGSRLVVVSTNVAETSLTIPGIRYVVDCGRAKEVHYLSPAVQSFQITWTSKASAQQRAGRAGRTGPGHCYRLYSSALYENHFEQFSEPEILRTPIEGIVLQMKSMHIDTVINFPFPTPPDRLALQKAERTLIHLGALTPDAASTATGRAMALFPLAPRFARMLVSGQQHGCLPYVITIVSALSVGDPFLFEESLNEAHSSDSEDDDDDLPANEAKRTRRKAFFQAHHLHASLGKRISDVFKSLSVAGAYEYAGGGAKFCAEHFVRLKAMEEIHKLRAQIGSIVRVNFPASDPKIFDKLPPPSEFQLKVLRQLLAASFIDQVAVRKDRIGNTKSSGVQFSNAKGVPYRAVGIVEDVFIHPSSVLIDVSPPDFVIFHELVRTSKPYMKGVTVVNPAWLAKLGKPLLCTFSKPLRNKDGVMMVIPRFGPSGWELPAIKAADTQ
ncbi:DHX37 protein [Ephemerocybe angulata]|uniref:RNA helicase n=1 Tax=Ephemerocybe angulata TaxID=980116 RepID=A0A8H6I245_9AGAR|nr:DHX37 protein [Tulosesus angulatus]